jgi:hypothetical protein
MSENQLKLTKKNNKIIGNDKNKKPAVSEINSGNRLISNKLSSLEYIKTNSIFSKKIDKKMNELEKNTIFMKKNIASKILLFYKKFKISLESSNYTVPMWQYNFFNTILETPTNNIENAIREFNKNFLTLSLENNKRINLQKNSQNKSANAAIPPLFNNNNNNNNDNAIDILERLLSEMGFSNFRVVLEKGKIILRGIHNEKCFGLIINSDNINIDCLSRCTIRGSQSLQIIENLAKRMPNIKYITLVDLSDIKILSSDIDINLAILKILTKGESWYNSFGYFSVDKTEKEHNKKIIDGNYYRDFVSNLRKKEGNSIKLLNITKICHDLYRPLISQSVKNYFNHIWTEIKNSKEKSKNNWFAEYLFIIIDANILRYSKTLRKYVR